MHKLLGWVLLAAGVAACSSSASISSPPPPDDRGSLRIVVNAVALPEDVDSIVFSTTAPGVADETLVDGGDGTWTGLLRVPPGTWDFTVTAYDVNGNPVGDATSENEVVAARSTRTIEFTIVGYGEPTPDFGPVVTVLAYDPAVDMSETIAVSAEAVDPDGDPADFTWLWTDECEDGSFGTFADETAPSTEWTAPDAETLCTITATVTSGGLSDSHSGEIAVSDPSASISASVTYVAPPVITQVQVSWGPDQGCGIFRSASSATCPTALKPGNGSSVFVSVDAHGELFDPQTAVTIATSPDCGEVAYRRDPEWNVPADVASFEWSFPPEAGTCFLTAHATVNGATDEFPIAVVFAGCGQDDDEPDNDTLLGAVARASDPEHGDRDIAASLEGTVMGGVIFVENGPGDYFAFQVRGTGTISVTGDVFDPDVAFEFLDDLGAPLDTENLADGDWVVVHMTRSAPIAPDTCTPWSEAQLVVTGAPPPPEP